jgi:hypothetical protein
MKELSSQARGAAPEGTKPLLAGDNDQLIEARGFPLPDGTRAPTKRQLCVRCGQECLPNGVCYCGATPVTQCVNSDPAIVMFPLAERRVLLQLLQVEYTELLLERRRLVSIRAARRDDSWSGRIADIDAREPILRSMISKVKV